MREERTWERADERLFACVRADVRDEREAGGLGQPAPQTRRPFAGVVRFVDADVVCEISQTRSTLVSLNTHRCEYGRLGSAGGQRQHHTPPTDT